jgi:hypothetical protein
MKKKLVSLILLISLKTLGDNCPKYAGIFEFCQDREVQCFENFVRSYTTNKNEIELLKMARSCPVIKNAISSSPNLVDLQNNASTIVQDVIKTYFFENGAGCEDLVEKYIDYAKDVKNCPMTLVQQCDDYSKALSLGQSSCKETAKVAQGAVKVYKTVAEGATKASNTLAKEATQAYKAAEEGATKAYKAAEEGATKTYNAVAAEAPQVVNTVVAGAKEAYNTFAEGARDFFSGRWF